MSKSAIEEICRAEAAAEERRAALTAKQRDELAAALKESERAVAAAGLEAVKYAAAERKRAQALADQTVADAGESARAQAGELCGTARVHLDRAAELIIRGIAGS